MVLDRTDSSVMDRIGVYDQDLQNHSGLPASLNNDRGDLTGLFWTATNPAFLFFPRLSQYPDLIHAVFPRQGGISDPPYHELNTSYEVRDRASSVTANLQRIRETLGANRLVYAHQCHGIGIQVISKTSPLTGVPYADALITNLSGLALMVKQADCQGVIILDPEKKVVAVVHCGWRGNVQNILGRVVEQMERKFCSRPQELIAAIGPSLGPCCAEFKGHRTMFPPSFEAFRKGDYHFDLWALSCRQLQAAGVRKDKIEVCGICTACRHDLFYSFRREGTTGRFATTAMLSPGG